MNLRLCFGAFAPSLYEQITAAGFVADEQGLPAVWQKDADAICRLRIRGFLTDAAADRANSRLFKQIEKHVRPANEALVGQAKAKRK